MKNALLQLTALLSITASLPTNVVAQDFAELERGVYQETNRLRTNPTAYARDVLEPMLERITEIKDRNGKVISCEIEVEPGLRFICSEGKAVVQEAIKIMLATSPMRPLARIEKLDTIARELVVIQGPTGETGHGPNGYLRSRFLSTGLPLREMRENISYADNDAIQTVAGLLVDDDVASRGHRHNLLAENLTHIGISCGPHAAYRTMCVQDFAELR